jgi:hypothetical protein
MILAIEFLYLNAGEENPNKVKREPSIRPLPANLYGDGVLREIILAGNTHPRMMADDDRIH